MEKTAKYTATVLSATHALARRQYTRASVMNMLSSAGTSDPVAKIEVADDLARTLHTHAGAGTLKKSTAL